MNNEKVILENTFKLHEKFILIFLPGVIVLMIILKLNQEWILSLVLICILFSIILVMTTLFAFSKKGLLINNTELFKAFFFSNILIYKIKIDLKTKTDVAILKSRSSIKPAYSVSENFDTEMKFNKFNISLLDTKHRNKALLISLLSEKKALNGVQFLTNNLELKHKKYNPKKKVIPVCNNGYNIL